MIKRTILLQIVSVTIVLASLISCKKETTDPQIEYGGKYVGSLEGKFFPADFPLTADTKISEPGEFVITANVNDGLISGFDSVPARMEFDPGNRSIFGVSDLRMSGEQRVSASGRFWGDTLDMTVGYTFLDKSRRSFRFIGVKQ